MIGLLEKKLGKEEVSVELTEWEMQSVLKAVSHWNKKLYRKIKYDLINEAVKEGYQISFTLPRSAINCPKCKEKIMI